MFGRSAKQERHSERPARSDAGSARAEQRKERLWWAGIVAMFAAAAVVLAVGPDRPSPAGSTLLEPAEDRPPPAARASSAKGLSPQIAQNLQEGNLIVDGDIGTRLESLEGVPVVVNQWASWCTSCRAEFPFFQSISRKYERRVAFLGLDSQDERGAAEAFLEDFPVNYPTVFDETAEQALRIGAGRAWPTTVFYDHTGRRTFVRQGGYASEAALEADLRRYALGR